MSIMRYSPFADFENLPSFRALEESMNRMFSQPAANRPWIPAVDIRETENELLVKADVPGVKFEDIDVRLENGTLTIKGQRKFEQDKTNGGWHRVERSYGNFERVFSLPETVDAEKVKADYSNGVLTVTLPKKEIAKPRQVKIQVNNN